MRDTRTFIARGLTAMALALSLGAVHAQLSKPEPGSKPPADRDLSGGKKMPTTGLVEKKNANNAAMAASGASSSGRGSASMPNGVNPRSNPITGDKGVAR